MDQTQIQQMIEDLIKDQNYKLQYPITQRKAIAKEVMPNYIYLGKNSYKVDEWKNKEGKVIDNYGLMKEISSVAAKYEDLSKSAFDAIFPKDESKVDYMASKVEEFIEKQGLVLAKGTKERVKQPQVAIAKKILDEFEPDASLDGEFILRRKHNGLLSMPFKLEEVLHNVRGSYFDKEAQEANKKKKEIEVRDRLVHEKGFATEFELKKNSSEVEVQQYEKRKKEETTKAFTLKADRDPLPFSFGKQKQQLEEKYIHEMGGDSMMNLIYAQQVQVQNKVQMELEKLSSYTTEAMEEQLKKESEYKAQQGVAGAA